MVQTSPSDPPRSPLCSVARSYKCPLSPLLTSSGETPVRRLVLCLRIERNKKFEAISRCVGEVVTARLTEQQERKNGFVSEKLLQFLTYNYTSIFLSEKTFHIRYFSKGLKQDDKRKMFLEMLVMKLINRILFSWEGNDFAGGIKRKIFKGN